DVGRRLVGRPDETRRHAAVGAHHLVRVGAVEQHHRLAVLVDGGDNAADVFAERHEQESPWCRWRSLYQPSWPGLSPGSRVYPTSAPSYSQLGHARVARHPRLACPACGTEDVDACAGKSTQPAHAWLRARA